jgi:hypothetical protein
MDEQEHLDQHVISIHQLASSDEPVVDLVLTQYLV